MRFVVLALAAAVAATAGPAAAQTPADRDDVRCLLVLQAVAARDPKQKDAAIRGVFYFMGRLQARGGLTRIEPTMIAEGRAIQTNQQFQAELTRCGAELTKRASDLQAVNQRLQEAARAAAAKAK